MTSATEQLRALLDERGVKTYHEQNYITWDDTNDYQCFAFETYERPGLLRVHCNLAPEQAIAATLGGERERELELLVKQLWYLVNHRSGYGYAAALESIEELGIEVHE